MFDLVTAGESFEDLVFFGLAALPKLGQEIKTNTYTKSPGGGAVITAVAAARLGLRCAIVSALSAEAEELLTREGVSVVNLRRPKEPIAISIVLSTPRDRSYVTFNGVNPRLPARIRDALSRMHARHVHFALYPYACGPWIPVVRRLRTQNVTTSWDLGWNRELKRDKQFGRLAESMDYLLLNRDEALLYAGRRRLSDALNRWSQSSRSVIVKLGASGSRIVGGGVSEYAPAIRVRAVDTTGAGDAFNAGFLVARLRGASLGEALAFGNHIGGLSTRRAGGTAALPRLRATRGVTR